MIDRQVFYDVVRNSLFGGALDQGQVDGMNALLDVWERHYDSLDPRWLAYCLGTTYHETSATMLPIEEYGKGAGQPYGEPDPKTHECYYGRGFVQLTWADNYKKADLELQLEGKQSCYWYPENACVPEIAAQVLYRGCIEGWFRFPHTLGTYFNDSTEDPYHAREVVNGDKAIVPTWSGGINVGELITGYYTRFLEALRAATAIPVPADHVMHFLLTVIGEGPFRIAIKEVQKIKE